MICPACEGSGKGRLGLSCADCGGMGTGIFEGGKFYYWGFKLSQAVIGINRARKKIQALINLCAFFIGLLGIAALGFFFYGFISKNEFPPLLTIWQLKHWTLLAFWLSLAADGYLVYRLAEDELLKQKVRVEKYSERTRDEGIASDWPGIKKLPRNGRIDVYSGFSLRTVRLIENGYLLSVKIKHGLVGPIEIFLNLFADSEVRSLFSRLNVNENDLIEKLKNQLAPLEQKTGRTELSNQVKMALINSYLSARETGQKRVKPVDLLLPLAAQDKTLSEILYDQEIDPDKLANGVAWFRINEKLVESFREYKSMARFKPSTSMDRAYTAVATPILNSFAYDLTAAAKWFKLEFCVDRDKEIKQVFAAIESGHSGVMLIGEPGVGKKTVVYGIAELMVKEEVPTVLQDKRLLELDISRLVSGGNPSEVQQRLLTVLDEIYRAGNIALYINNLETIIGISAGSEESLDLSDVLVNALEHRGIFCLASVTRSNFLKFVERTPLDNTMAKVEIAEPAGNQAIVILESKIGYFESTYGVYFTYGAIEEAVKLSSRYMHDKYLPEKAIKILEAVAVKKSKQENKLITKEAVAAEVSETTGIPVTKVSADEGRELLNLEERIHERMIDQVEAVDAVSAALRRARAQLTEGKRPTASFLFLGPTGVGKTELAKAVAAIYFGAEKYLIRVDMSEYQTQDSVNKMIGSPEGGKGYLTEAMRQTPFSLLLLDEFEKAHPDILNLFLQVMDDGRLTDGSGKTIDFTNSIIIATSNAGALYIQEEIKKNTPIEKIKEVLINEQLNKIMRPELLNRFDGIIVFKPLGIEEVVEIARLLVKKTAKLLEQKGIGLKIEEAGLKRLAELGFDPKFGARPLRRLMQDRIENNIANKLLADELSRRDTVVIDENGEIKIEKGRAL